MGKVPFTYTGSEETEDTSSSVENVKKKKKLSILKYTNGSFRKKKCKLNSKSEPDDSDYRTRSRTSHRSTKHKLNGILKHTERELSSEEDEDSEPARPIRPLDRCLVGRVPRPAGGKPGRGGGVAIIVKKNINALQAQESSSSSTKKRRSTKRLSRKRSF